MNRTWFPDCPPVDHYQHQIEIHGDYVDLTHDVLNLEEYLYDHEDILKGKWGYEWRYETVVSSESVIISAEHLQDFMLIKFLYGEV